jgi:uncharacterized glyoxalase superfamily protein PhnB
MVSTEVRIEVQARLVIERVDDAIAFYRAAFGAELIERFVDASGVVVHAAIRIGTSIVTMAEEVKAWKLLGPTAIGGSPVLLHLTLQDPDGVCARLEQLGVFRCWVSNGAFNLEPSEVRLRRACDGVGRLAGRGRELSRARRCWSDQQGWPTGTVALSRNRPDHVVRHRSL